MSQPDKINVLFVTTGRINPDGRLYYPPLVEAQIKSLSPQLGTAEVVILYSFQWAVIRETIRAIRSGARNADVVHAQYGSFTAFFAWLGNPGRPLVISFGGSDLLGSASTGFRGWLRNRVTYFFGTFAARRSAALIVKSSNLLKALPSCLHGKTTVVPNGVNTSVFYPILRAEARKKLGWNDAARYIIFTPSRANNVIVKNVTLAVAVAEEVKQMLGNTSLEYILDKSPEEVSLMMNAADCLLLTSLHEGSPNVIKEAMACGLPIVSTNVGDVAERLLGVYPSRVVNTWEKSALAEAVAGIVRTPSRSNGAEQLRTQNLTQEASASVILGVYHKIIKRK